MQHDFSNNKELSEDAAREMKTRLRGDLRTAMKGRNSFEIEVLRGLIARLDNAEAPSQPEYVQQRGPYPHDFQRASTEVERLLLSRSQVKQVLLDELQEREQAAIQLEVSGSKDRADTLRRGILVIRRYL